MFRDGVELDRFIETTAETLWLTGTVRIQDRHVILGDVVLYPTSGVRTSVGMRDMLAVRQLIEDELRSQGFESYTIQAVRGSSGKKRRIVNMRRSLG